MPYCRRQRLPHLECAPCRLLLLGPQLALALRQPCSRPIKLADALRQLVLQAADLQVGRLLTLPVASRPAGIFLLGTKPPLPAPAAMKLLLEVQEALCMCKACHIW
jgi:hypothetical protein